MEVKRKKAVRLAIKINFYLVVLILAYYLLQIVILKGKLYNIENFLVSLFYINCFIVFLKILRK